jgi:hypothetical protein
MIVECLKNLWNEEWVGAEELAIVLDEVDELVAAIAGPFDGKSHGAVQLGGRALLKSLYITPRIRVWKHVEVFFHSRFAGRIVYDQHVRTVGTYEACETVDTVSQVVKTIATEDGEGEHLASRSAMWRDRLHCWCGG